MRKVLLAFVIVFVIAAVFLIFIKIYNKNLITQRAIDNENEVEKEATEKQSSDSEDDKLTSGLNSEENSINEGTAGYSGRESGGGGGGGSSSGGSSSACIETQISYALKNFIKVSECNLYQGETCVDKTITCSVDVQNLDREIGGLFVINIRFYNEEIGESSQISTVQKEKNVAPLSTEKVEATLNLQGEEANKNVGCTFTTEQVPKKLVC